MDTEAWREAYIGRLMEHGLSRSEAIGYFQGIECDIDFRGDPVDAADESFSYYER